MGQALAIPPPLSQSRMETMACEYCYKLVYIDGIKPPNTQQSDRGTDIHAVLAQYAEHCAKKHVPADFMYLEFLCTSLGDEAAEILESCRESLTIDWQNFMAAEISMGLDRDFQATWSVDHDLQRVEISDVWDFPGTDKTPAYCGILDTIYLMPGGKVARIVDWKSHPRAFPADSFQGKLYNLMLMMHLPELTEVEFGLKFVRYANVVTTHKYFRADVPQMMEDVRRVRNRQREIHEKVADQMPLRTRGGSHCAYCPCVLAPEDVQCPIMRLNPMTNMKPDDRLNWRLVHDAMKRVNDQALKQHVEGTGASIYSQDANGKVYSFGPVEKQKITFPLFAEDGQGGFTLPVVDRLLDWQNANPEDLQPKRGGKPWFLNLRIGSTQLKSYLKAKKREIIDNAIKDVALTENKVEYTITRDASVDDGTGEEHRTWDADGDEEIAF